MHGAGEQRRAPAPDGFAGNCLARDGPLAPVLLVELRVKGVVEEHPADIDERRARAEPREAAALAAAREVDYGPFLLRMEPVPGLDETLEFLHGRYRTALATNRGSTIPRLLGHFDLAMTGRDWLRAFTASFPAAPIVELCDLKRSKYRMGAVIAEDLPVASIEEAIAYWRRDDPERPIRVASEYASLADEYARSRHLRQYRVIPISGASEGFVPEDAEILIEGTETGSTLRANRLRMIDVIMESTNCAIGAATRPSGRRGELRDQFVQRLAAAAEASD